MSELAEQETELKPLEGVEEVPVAEELPADDAHETLEADEVIVSIGEDAPPPEEEKDPGLVKHLRKTLRETTRKAKELEAKLQALTETKPAELGKRPELADPDIDYDEDKFLSKTEAWLERKRKVDDEKRAALEAEKAQEAEWRTKMEAYNNGKLKLKDELKLRDVDEAEENVREAFSVTQQGAILDGSDDPALLIHALGKDTKLLKELSEIKSISKFIFRVAKLEAKDLKVTKRNSPPPPERTVTSTGSVAGSIDSTLAKLEAEAEKTGDRTKIVRYKAEMKAKGKT